MARHLGVAGPSDDRRPVDAQRDQRGPAAQGRATIPAATGRRATAADATAHAATAHAAAPAIVTTVVTAPAIITAIITATSATPAQRGLRSGAAIAGRAPATTGPAPARLTPTRAACAQWAMCARIFRHSRATRSVTLRSGEVSLRSIEGAGHSR